MRCVIAVPFPAALLPYFNLSYTISPFIASVILLNLMNSVSCLPFGVSTSVCPHYSAVKHSSKC